MSTTQESSVAVAEKTDTLLSIKHSLQALSQIDQIAAECSLGVFGESSMLAGIAMAFKMSAAVQMMRDLITEPMLKDIIALQGSKIGFVTDRDAPKDSGPKGYPPMIVRDVFIEATIRGARMVGNEVNIIAGGCYLTKNFFTRMLRDYPGLTDLKIAFGAPERVASISRAMISARASWVLNGRPDSMQKLETKSADGTCTIDERFMLKYDNYTSDDALLGKADRKFKALIFSRITGTQYRDGDLEDGDVIEGTNNVLLPAQSHSMASLGLKDVGGSTVEAEKKQPQQETKKTEEVPQQTAAAGIGEESEKWRASLRERLAKCHLCRDVNELQKELSQKAPTPDDLAYLNSACKDHREAIRG